MIEVKFMEIQSSNTTKTKVSPKSKFQMSKDIQKTNTKVSENEQFGVGNSFVIFDFLNLGLLCSICRICSIWISDQNQSLISGGIDMHYGTLEINNGTCVIKGGPDDRRPMPPFPQRKERGYAL
jgi:hypothetical protein